MVVNFVHLQFTSTYYSKSFTSVNSGNSTRLCGLQLIPLAPRGTFCLCDFLAQPKGHTGKHLSIDSGTSLDPLPQNFGAPAISLKFFRPPQHLHWLWLRTRYGTGYGPVHSITFLHKDIFYYLSSLLINSDDFQLPTTISTQFYWH